jgi:hypothetical protein
MVRTLQAAAASAAVTSRFAPPGADGSAFVHAHSDWIEDELGAPVSDLVALFVDFPLRALALDRLLDGQLWKQEQHDWSAARADILEMRFGGDMPQMKLNPVDQRISGEPFWHGTLRNGLVVMRLRGLRFPVAVCLYDAVEPHARGGFKAIDNQMALVHPSDSAAFLRMLFGWTTHGRKRVRVFGGEDFFLQPEAYSWDDVLLDPQLTALIRRDFEHFLERRSWFRERRVPWRRGYLLHGPPGNGKTSVVRAMACQPSVSAFTINFASDYVDDSTVTQLFTAAAEHAPGLVILEELDRAFLPDKKGDCTLPHLLNTLDGVGNAEGVIVVASANHPEDLDTRILKRPGRFDRVVHFGPPSFEMRQEYLQRHCPELTREQLAACAAASEHMSFAQLREVWLLANQLSYDAGEALAGRHLEQALTQMRTEHSCLARSGRVGFQ